MSPNTVSSVPAAAHQQQQQQQSPQQQQQPLNGQAGAPAGSQVQHPSPPQKQGQQGPKDNASMVEQMMRNLRRASENFETLGAGVGGAGDAAKGDAGQGQE